MTNILNAAMLETTRLTHAGRLTEATAALQRMLRGGHAAPGVAVPANASLASRNTPDDVAESAKVAHADRLRGAAALPGARLLFDAERGTRRLTPERMHGFLPHGALGGFHPPSGGLDGQATSGTGIPVPDGAQFLASTFSNEAGSRPYKVYVPSGYRPGRPVPLIVMLHGCTQSPDDFAAGTRMNEAAEEHICLIAYPGQIASANMQKCWNWFSERDQHRGQGEPALIADIARQVMHDYTIDPQRVYVAGLSAGGAAAAIMGDTYPDLFAAIGVHSGLACGAARDMQSAFAAMQGRGAPNVAAPRPRPQRRIVPAIVFHGDHDRTVNPRNADAVVLQSAQAGTLHQRTEQRRASGGRAYSRTVSTDEAGRTVIEQWVVHGAGHAWSGGSTAGSYTDPQGPDATREMLRFFLDHPHPAPDA